MGSRSLDRNESKLTDPFCLGTLLYKSSLNGRDRGLNRNPLCSSSSSRSHGLSHHINPIKETLHGCAHGSRNLLSCGVIDGDGLELNLKNEK